MPPGEAQHPLAGAQKVGVACAVGLERRARSMRREAVGLHDQAVLWPVEVDLVAGELHVAARERETGRRDELEEAVLELAAGEDVLRVVGEQPSERRGARAPAAQVGRERRDIERRSRSARWRTRDSVRASTTDARSAIVRAGVVVGIAFSSVTWFGSRQRGRCRTMPGRAPRPVRAGLVTSTFARLVGRRSHRAAALRWLRTASGPHARTAASQRPSRRSTGWPKA